MAKDEIPQSYESLIELLEDAAAGADMHAGSIGLSHNTPQAIRADLEALVGQSGVLGLKALWEAAKADKTVRTTALHIVQSNGRALAMACINTLKPNLGRKWNSHWNAVGFTDATLDVPVDPMIKLQQLRAYYLANPTREAVNVNGLNCTAAACGSAAQAISDAQLASNHSNIATAAARATLETGINACRNRLIGLRAELSELLADDDPRWLAFGFELPGTVNSPEPPANLVVIPGQAGSRQLFFDWGNARRAESYRIKVTDDAAAAVLVDQIVWESEFMASNLPKNTTVTAVVTGRNSYGPSKPTASVSATVP